MSVKARTLDFTGVKDGGGNFRPRRRKEGDYFAHIVAVADHTSKEDNEGWVFTIKVDGDARASYPYYVNFDTKQLWKSRNLCIAAGIKVPSAKVKLDPNKLVGKAIGLALEDDEYEGRVKSTIAAVFPLDELTDPMNAQDGKSAKAKAKSREAEDYEDDEEEDEEPPAKSKSKKKAAPEPDEDDEEEDDEDDEPPAPKKKSKSAPKRRRDEDDDEDEEDDEDDEPPAKKPKGKTKGASAKKGKSKRAKDDDEDDEELDLDDL